MRMKATKSNFNLMGCPNKSLGKVDWSNPRDLLLPFKLGLLHVGRTS